MCRTDWRPCRPDWRPWRPGWRPWRPGWRPWRPGWRPWRPGFGEEDVCTDKIPLFFRISPASGLLPKKDGVAKYQTAFSEYQMIIKLYMKAKKCFTSFILPTPLFYLLFFCQFASLICSLPNFCPNINQDSRAMHRAVVRNKQE